jgi:hypothetical protein
MGKLAGFAEAQMTYLCFIVSANAWLNCPPPSPGEPSIAKKVRLFVAPPLTRKPGRPMMGRAKTEAELSSTSSTSRTT